MPVSRQALYDLQDALLPFPVLLYLLVTDLFIESIGKISEIAKGSRRFGGRLSLVTFLALLG